MRLDIVRTDVVTTRTHHLLARVRIQVYSGRGQGPLTVDVSTIRQVTDARGHDSTEAYVHEDGERGAWKLLTPHSEMEVLKALANIEPGRRAR